AAALRPLPGAPGSAAARPAAPARGARLERPVAGAAARLRAGEPAACQRPQPPGRQRARGDPFLGQLRACRLGLVGGPRSGRAGRVRQAGVIERAAATVIEKARQLDGTVAQEQIRQSPGDLFFSGDLAATPRSRATRWDLTRGGSWSSSDAPGAPKP